MGFGTGTPCCGCNKYVIDPCPLGIGSLSGGWMGNDFYQINTLDGRARIGNFYKIGKSICATDGSTFQVVTQGRRQELIARVPYQFRFRTDGHNTTIADFPRKFLPEVMMESQTLLDHYDNVDHIVFPNLLDWGLNSSNIRFYLGGSPFGQLFLVFHSVRDLSGFPVPFLRLILVYEVGWTVLAEWDVVNTADYTGPGVLNGPWLGGTHVWNNVFNTVDPIANFGMPFGLYKVQWQLVANADKSLYRPHLQVWKDGYRPVYWFGDYRPLHRYLMGQPFWNVVPPSTNSSYWLAFWPQQSESGALFRFVDDPIPVDGAVQNHNVEFTSFTNRFYNESFVTDQFEITTESPDWTVLSTNSFEWENPYSTDPNFNAKYRGGFQYPFSLGVRDLGVSFSLTVDPNSVYRLSFNSENGHMFIVLIDDRIVYDPRGLIAGAEAATSFRDNTTFSGYDEDNPYITALGFYFASAGKTQLKVRVVGLTGWPEYEPGLPWIPRENMVRGKITNLRLWKTDVPDTEKLWEPYPFVIWAGTASSISIGWRLTPESPKTVKPDPLAMPGVGPWTFTVIEGSLPTGSTLNSDTGELTLLETTPVTSGLVAFGITDSTNTKFRTRIYLWTTDPVYQFNLMLFYPLSFFNSLPFDDSVNWSFQLYREIEITPTELIAGFPFSISLHSGSLPSGVSVDSTGIISGTPTSISTGTATFKLTQGTDEFVTIPYTWRVADFES